MPLLEEQKNNQNKQSVNNNQTDNCGFEKQTNPNTKSQSGLLTIIGQLLPLAPFAFEQFTGQKVPAMTGTMADIQANIQNIQTNLQVIVQNQQALSQRLIQLETNASQQFTNLIQQVQTVQSLRLTHQKERQEIEYNPTKSESNY